MSKITLSNVADLTQVTTAQTTINNNSSTVQTAFDNTLSRDGTNPNTMGANLDMNSNQILNLPAPATVNSPARLIDVTNAPIISSVPPVGTSGAVVGLLNANKTDSGNNTFSGTNTFSVAPVLPVNSIANATLAQVPTLTLKGNNTGGTANEADLTVSQVNTMLGVGPLSSINVWTANQEFKAGPIYDVKAFGAVGNNVADDTSAIQAAITAVTAVSGGIVFFPQGTYKVTSQINITSGMTLAGCGTISTVIAPNGNFTCFAINTASAVTTRDMQILFPASSTGIGINVTAVTENVLSKFYNLQISNAGTSINFVRASLWHVDSCYFAPFTTNGITVDNQNVGDSGDSCISNCIFSNSSSAAGVGIIQKASGGLKIVNCKFNVMLVGYQMNLTTTTVDLLISNCSFENFGASGFAINFNQSTAAQTFANVTITGCEIGSCKVGIITDTNTWLNNVTIVGNNITTNVAAGIAVNFTNVTDVTISGNTIIGSGGGTTGVSITTGTNTLVIGNQIQGYTTNRTASAGTLHGGFNPSEAFS